MTMFTSLLMAVPHDPSLYYRQQYQNDEYGAGLRYKNGIIIANLLQTDVS